MVRPATFPCTVSHGDCRDSASAGRIPIEPTADLRARQALAQTRMERFQMYRVAGIFAAFAILVASALPPAAAQDKTLTVFAAASMKNALDDIDTAFTAKTGVKIVASYAASSALAKQIEQ